MTLYEIALVEQNKVLGLALTRLSYGLRAHIAMRPEIAGEDDAFWLDYADKALKGSAPATPDAVDGLQGATAMTLIEMMQQSGIVSYQKNNWWADERSLNHLEKLIRADEREAIAQWHAIEGWMLDEEDVPDAIRDRKTNLVELHQIKETP
jgi:hypothetical protein